MVGFGPTGAVAAGPARQAGLKVCVCDRTRGVYDKPRAIALDHEILRVFQQLGVIDDVMPHLEPFTPSEYFGVDGQLIRRMTMVEPPFRWATRPRTCSRSRRWSACCARASPAANVTAALGVDVRRADAGR